jgi:hypothetical protein
MTPAQARYPSAAQEWLCTIPVMQQSVLFSGIRGMDGLPKRHDAKQLVRWYRRCVLISAFDGSAIVNPYAEGGGDFTGPLTLSLYDAEDAFLRARDEMPLHYFSHMMHAFQILGEHHPDKDISAGWRRVYTRMVAALHLLPEPTYMLNDRLSDNIVEWKAREDCAGGCST